MGKRDLPFTLTLLLVSLLNCNCYPENIPETCPRLYGTLFKGCIPRANISAGVFQEMTEITKLRTCVLECCLKEACNVAFMSESKCYHVSCKDDESCVPVYSPHPETSDHLVMVLVKPVEDVTWADVLRREEISKMLLDDQSNYMLEEEFRDLWKDDDFGPSYCDVHVENSCLMNEECVQQHPKFREGICQCIDGYVRDPKGKCLPVDEMSILPNLITDRIILSNVTVGQTTSGAPNRAVPVTRRHLIVKVASKEVRLPVNEVSLLAKVEPEDPDENYLYEWGSLHQPDGSTAVKHQNGGELKLEKLTEGVYSFKVAVSTSTAYGETYVNVTVLPAKRINKPPTIIITPANQTIKLPNSAAVLDASSSTDDDGISAWHWELQQGPLGYEPQLKDNPTLQLNDLTKPGNYTFKLTVTDTDHETSSKTANISVLAGIDYPPEANAGEDKIIYLPHNSITLSGNQSIDDHAITTWEWTKSADDAQKAVDMQDTRTPFLQLSNLEEGMYTFTLKVTDSANQSSTAQVHVFVKPPTNKPPVAVAGPNQTISLPQTWVGLDAGNSTDDNKILSFKWEQLDGPSTVTFENANASKTNVTGLTKGTYTFKVSVTDDNNNVASDMVAVTVNQNHNQKPTADAGKPFEVELPKNVVMLNGSKSKDDWAIVKWKWERDPNSLALGKIVEKTDESSVLIVTDLTVGKYIFNLTVYDEQGLSDSDSVTFTVRHDPMLFYIVEMTVNVDANALTQAQYENLKGKLALLVKDGSKLEVRGVRAEPGSYKTVITFYVDGEDGKPVPANVVVKYLREKMRVDASLLGFSVAKLQTAICQNNCSGHGICDENTRKCKCEVFWMQDMFKVYLNADEDSDCDWSILYVVLGMICSVLLFFGILWGTVHLCYSWCSKRKSTTKPTTYKLIEDTEDLPPFTSRKSNLSDSDTDSDVVFETRSKPYNRIGRKGARNGFGKLSGRVKT